MQCFYFSCCNQINVISLHVIQLSLPTTPPVKCSPVKIVEEGEDKKGQLAPGLLHAELERVTVHHGCRVVEQLLRVRWRMKVPTTEGKDHIAGSWPVPDPGGERRREGGRGRWWEEMGKEIVWKKWHDELGGHYHAADVGEIVVEYVCGDWPFAKPLLWKVVVHSLAYIAGHERSVKPWISTHFEAVG